ncbi:response regulator [Janthinobacterium sp.]|uniref:response regulator n=1 Tax=Janthinobacterium sp. TaxID=1871054 RepID=UPI00293D5AF2|nr:response regulator [Janthinobacterium sp.]
MSPAPNPLRVLIVDDDSFQLEVLRDMLDTLGVADVELATGGQGALAALGADRGAPDLLICDLHMPGMNGFQFMESVANLGYPNGVLIVSGQSGNMVHSAGLVAQLRRLNLLGALEKPVSPEQLRGVIDSLRAAPAR